MSGLARAVPRCVVAGRTRVYTRRAHMKKSVSIVAARRELGRLAAEVSRTGQSVVLTRRGRAVARIAPGPGIEQSQQGPGDAFAELRGTVRLNCDLAELRSAIRELRAEARRSLGRRARALAGRGARGRA